MADWQRNQHIADIGGAFSVYVARWPGYPGGRSPRVMWETPSGHYEYLSTSAARKLAQALVLAVVEAETGEEAHAAPNP